MKFDAMLRVHSLADAARQAAELEDRGFDGLWAAEKDHDPYLILALAASATRSVTLGTAVSLAFNRSPMSIAQTCWDLQALSGGRFVLGLGSQVRAHIERRFSAAWSRPVERMDEAIRSLRAIWQCWQTGTKLDFQGEYYRFDLMTPAFTPPPLAGPVPPIYLGGVNAGMVKLAGRLCDGFHVHPFHSRAFLSQVILPTLAEGAIEAGRPLSDLCISASVLCITDDASRRSVRERLAFYASTKAYRPVLAIHGWEDAGFALGRLAAAGQWQEMPGLITDEMVETFAIVGDQEGIRDKAGQCYGGLVQRLTLDVGPGADRGAQG